MRGSKKIEIRCRGLKWSILVANPGGWGERKRRTKDKFGLSSPCPQRHSSHLCWRLRTPELETLGRPLLVNVALEQHNSRMTLRDVAFPCQRELAQAQRILYPIEADTSARGKGAGVVRMVGRLRMTRAC